MMWRPALRCFILWTVAAGASLGAEEAGINDPPPRPQPVKKSFYVRYKAGGKRVSRRGFAILPPKRAGGGPIPWVWYAPMLRDDRGHQTHPSKRHNWMFERLVKAGFAVAGVDVGESWGNPAGRLGFTKFYEHMIKEFGLAPKACILAEDRGMLMVLNWAAENADKVQRIGAIYPVCKITPTAFFARMYDLAGNDNDKENEAALKAAFKQHNPMDRLEPLAKAKVPMLLLHGINDKVVPAISHSGDLTLRYRKLGGPVRFVLKRNERHEPTDMFFRSPDLLKFFLKQIEKPKAKPDAPAPPKKTPAGKAGGKP
jgi:pimeloyl-ACP methyl ester carboxylesterase